jgi:23S rRNA (uridine2552-2'-O)-methyltransferase
VRPPKGGDPAGRGTGGQKLKSGRERTPSSTAWLERQLQDPFVAAARAKGYRSRAAFKLTEIDGRHHVIRRGARVIDLGCAPGGWMQVAIERGAAVVAGVDLLPVDPLPPPAMLIQGDFTDLGLIEAAAVFALEHLKPGGGFVTKTFQGGGSGELLASLKPQFEMVKHVKPKASRSESSEVYLVALGRR